ncbi:hypothetical protein ABZX85_12015 [Streptomyces sp. NPDC004539]|uniref:hypothetical protein n=1 Tax=Streptomyces sp. NPDC004539 TaxID=3154280 RepID=UPI0033AF2AA3
MSETSLREGAEANLRAVFGGADGCFLTDDPGLAAWLTEHGLRASTFAGVLSGRQAPPPRAVAVPLDYRRLPSRLALRDILSASSVLWMSLASFSGDPETARYAIEKFSEIDLDDAVAMNRRIITRLLLSRTEIGVSGPGTELTLRLPETLQLSSRTRTELLPDEHSTIGNYFEVAMSPTDLAGRVDTELSISGTLRIDSVLVARHRELRGARADRFEAAKEIAEDMRKACPLYVTVEDNRFVGGFGPWADGIDDTSGPAYRTAVTEIAVGTGLLDPARVDWSLNCLLNEGAAGIHLGVGNGLDGMHFDFISTEARLVSR